MGALRRLKICFRLATVLLFAALFSGCVSVYNVGMADKTPTAMGKIRLYSTDNVPFVYEELAFLSVRVDGSPGSPPAQDYVLELFQREAAKSGADAVVNFKIEEAFWSDWLFFPGGSSAIATGTGVSIVRP